MHESYNNNNETVLHVQRMINECSLNERNTLKYVSAIELL